MINASIIQNMNTYVFRYKLDMLTQLYRFLSGYTNIVGYKLYLLLPFYSLIRKHINYMYTMIQHSLFDMS